jgi:hypothetical protein
MNSKNLYQEKPFKIIFNIHVKIIVFEIPPKNDCDVDL